MLKTYLKNYQNFPKEIWILVLMTFINRAGTMVIPFLSKYLSESLHFNFNQIGWILVFFGLGSIIGTWLSGKLSDIIGFYKVMVISLFATGFIFFALQFITSFVGFCIGIFILTSIADMFRPAMLVSLSTYTRKENSTRALTLVRSAVNLGFLFGPAIGGLIIMNSGYSQLFYIDGATCILGVIVFILFVKERKLPYKLIKHNIVKDNQAIIKDKPFMVHLIITTISGILFFQIFTVLPLYEKFQFNLSDFNCGLLLGINGIVILLFELPIVNYVEKNKLSKFKVIMVGLFFMVLSFVMLLLVKTTPLILVFMMISMSLGVMLTFPFASFFATTRSHANQEGKYMSIFTMSYSFAHILGAKTSLNIIHYNSYDSNWIFMISIGILGILLAFWLKNVIGKENEERDSKISHTIFIKNQTV